MGGRGRNGLLQQEVRLMVWGSLAVICQVGHRQPGLWVSLVLQEGLGACSCLVLCSSWFGRVTGTPCWELPVYPSFNLKQHIRLVNYKNLDEILKPLPQECSDFMDWYTFQKTTHSCQFSHSAVFIKHLLRTSGARSLQIQW